MKTIRYFADTGGRFVGRLTNPLIAIVVMALFASGLFSAGCAGSFSTNTKKGLASAQSFVHASMNGYGASVRAGFVDAGAQKSIDSAYGDWQLAEKAVSDAVRAYDAVTDKTQQLDVQAKVTAALAAAVKAGNELYALIQKLTGPNKSGALRYLKERYGEDLSPAMLDGREITERSGYSFLARLE